MTVTQARNGCAAAGVEVANAGTVDEIRPLAASEEDRFAPHAAERARRAVHTAGNQLLSAGKGPPAFFASHVR